MGPPSPDQRYPFFVDHETKTSRNIPFVALTRTSGKPQRAGGGSAIETGPACTDVGRRVGRCGVRSCIRERLV